MSSRPAKNTSPPQIAWAKRLLTAAIAIPLLIGIISAHRSVMAVAQVLALSIGYGEFTTLVGNGHNWNYILFAALTATRLDDRVVIPSLLLNLFVPLWAQGPEIGLRNGLFNILFYTLFAIPITYASKLRDLPDGSILALVWILASFASDAGALVIGSRFGQHKCCPQISPKKTWEGMFGALAFATCAIFGFHFLKIYRMTTLDIMAYSLISSVCGMTGDLIESGFKRFVNAKDSSDLLPGHGGMLDRLDALAASVPFFYFYSNR